MNNEKAEIEIWKPIPGHPQYEVSNMGRVKRLPGYQNSRRGPAYHNGGNADIERAIELADALIAKLKQE